MNQYVVVEVLENGFKVLTGSLSYDGSVKALNVLKRANPTIKFDY